MKQTLKNILSILAIAVIGFTGLASESFAQQPVPGWKPFQKNGISCQRYENGVNYPQNGKFYYCGDPNLPTNIAQHRDGYLTNILQTVPASTRNSMANALLTNGTSGPVEFFVFCTKFEGETFFGRTFPGITDQETAFFNKPTNQILVFQWLTANNLGCAAPVAQRTEVYSRAYRAMDHEIGHFVDWRKNVPAGQVRHSVDISTKLYRKYLQKDIDWINSTTRGGAFVPCTNIFTDARDKFEASDKSLKPVCNGTTRNVELNNLSTFDIMKKVMPYFVSSTASVDIETGASNTSWGELFAETFNKAIGTTSSQNSLTSSTPTYLFGSYFLCSTRYIQIYANNGTAPQPADLLSPYNRCVLP